MMENLVGLRLNPLLSDITTLSDYHTESVTDFFDFNLRDYNLSHSYLLSFFRKQTTIALFA